MKKLVTKLAYLTIDDAPSEDMINKVDFLASKKIPAIFFCEGYYLSQRPTSAIYAIKKGFIIGNHSYNHPHFSDVNINKCFNEIQKTDKIINNLYDKAGIERILKVFRFPYGDNGCENSRAIQGFLKKLGYRQPNFQGIKYKWFHESGLLDDIDVSWTYDCLEWQTFKKYSWREVKNLNDVLKRMDENRPDAARGLNYKGSNEIILAHDHVETKDMFVPIIEKLISKNIKFVLPSKII